MTLPEQGLSPSRIAEAVAQANLNPLPEGAPEKFSNYYALLERWNSRLNLTAIQGPEEVLHRHFIECIFCAQHLPAGIATLLDYGSGAGFPGIPIALCRPQIRVTLAESQGKKASFLREAARLLGISTEIWGGRVEDMPFGRSFDAVSLRAVDKMQEAVLRAAGRVGAEGWLVLLASGTIELPTGFTVKQQTIPGSLTGRLVLACRGGCSTWNGTGAGKTTAEPNS